MICPADDQPCTGDHSEACRTTCLTAMYAPKVDPEPVAKEGSSSALLAVGSLAGALALILSIVVLWWWALRGMDEDIAVAWKVTIGMLVAVAVVTLMGATA